MHIVAALGGNALLKRGEALTAAAQAENIAIAAQALAGLAQAGHLLTVTHGNGPQVGLLALETGGAGGSHLPLDVLDAETEGWIGYQLETALANALPAAEIATLLTRVRVDAADPEFAAPTKPVGPVYEESEARRLQEKFGWHIAPDGAAWRRVVASPKPLDIFGAGIVKRLAAQGVIVICAGGGGIPVSAGPDGRLHGVEAVVDKDLASALLATKLDADLFLILTDVDAVYQDFGTPAARRIARAAASELMEQKFASGSMGPKIRAACAFVNATGRPAAIGRLGDAAAILTEESGTWIV